MKQLLLIFALFFTMFGIVGYRVARDTKESDEYLKFYIASHMEVVDAGSRPRLAYNPGERRLWSLDLVDSRAKFADLMSPAAAELEARESSISVSKEMMVGILGGFTGAWTAKDILELLQTKKGSDPRRVIAGIFGGVSGFSLGYWIGGRQDPPHLSANVTRLLSDAANYREIKRFTFLFQLREHGDTIRMGITQKHLFAEPPDYEGLRDAEEGLVQLMDKARDPNHEFSADDFGYFRYVQFAREAVDRFVKEHNLK